MLISKFAVPDAAAASSGLSSIQMSRLDRFVAIAGTNGAGKSRLLQLLDQFVTAHQRWRHLKDQWIKQIETTRSLIANNPANPSLHDWQRQIAELEKHIEDAGYITPRADRDFKTLYFVPKRLNLTDPMTLTPAQLKAAFESAKSGDIDSIAESCLGYIQYVQNVAWNTSHQDYADLGSERDEAVANHAELNRLILALLGFQVGRLSDGSATIFNRRLAAAGLSDGQKVILQFAVAIHAKRGSLDNTIFILDEIENHLHPSVTIELLGRIVSVAPNAQIWIATHSVPLLAYVVSVDPMALWYMDQGIVSHAGRYPEKVLESLLGDSDRIGQLNSFTGLPAQLAAVNYAAESLLPPLTVGGGTGDPQVSQIGSIIANKFQGNVPVVLDFGAGKGRLLEGLAAQYEGSDIFPISYLALDDSDKDRDKCISVIAEHFPDASRRHFSSVKQFYEGWQDCSVDLVVMCNVLHEIPPAHWLSLVAHSTSILQRGLKNDGYLLLVEDQRIPIGEKAHELGFLVLDTAQLKTLFGVTQADIDAGLFVADDFRNDGRLKAHLISKSLLARMTAETRNLAIRQLQQSCLEEISRLRGLPPSYSNGQLHGFWTQQFTNAHLYLIQHE